MNERENKNKSFMINENVILFLLIFITCVVFIPRLTYAGLCLDESVEYFYSKVLTGNVPFSYDTDNMYERICSTYQPPLYNVLMHFWIMLFDSEMGFRFSALFFTILGGIGVYKMIIAETNKWIWGEGIYYILQREESLFMLLRQLNIV